MTQYRRSPRPVATPLERVQSALAPDSLLADVQRVWSATVGEVIAAEARPVAARGGVLTVACAASVWAQELDLMGPELIGRLNVALGGGSLTRLRCVATPPRGG